MRLSVLPLIAGILIMALILGGVPTHGGPPPPGPTTIVVVDPDGNILDARGLSMLASLESETGAITPFSVLASLVLLGEAGDYASQMEDQSIRLQNLSKEVDELALSSSYLASAAGADVVDLPKDLSSTGLWRDAVDLLEGEPSLAPRAIGLIAELKYGGVDSDGVFMDMGAFGEWGMAEDLVLARSSTLALLSTLRNRTITVMYALEQGLGDRGELAGMLKQGVSELDAERLENATRALPLGDPASLRENITALDGAFASVSDALLSLIDYRAGLEELSYELAILNETAHYIILASGLIEDGDPEGAGHVLELLCGALEEGMHRLGALLDVADPEVYLSALAPQLPRMSLLGLLQSRWSMSATEKAMPLAKLEGDLTGISEALLTVGNAGDFAPWVLHPRQPTFVEARERLLGDTLEALWACSRVLSDPPESLGPALKVIRGEGAILDEIYRSSGSLPLSLAPTSLGSYFSSVSSWAAAQLYRLRQMEEEFSMLLTLVEELDGISAWLDQALFEGMGIFFSAGVVLVVEGDPGELADRLSSEGYLVEFVAPDVVSDDLWRGFRETVTLAAMVSAFVVLAISILITRSLILSLPLSIIPSAAGVASLRITGVELPGSTLLFPPLVALSSGILLTTIFMVMENLNAGFGRGEAVYGVLIRPGGWHSVVASASLLGLSVPAYFLDALVTAALTAMTLPPLLLHVSVGRKLRPATPMGPLVRLTSLFYRNLPLALLILSLLLLPLLHLGPPPSPADYLPRGAHSHAALDVLEGRVGVPGPAILSPSRPDASGYLNVSLIAALGGDYPLSAPYAYFGPPTEGWLGAMLNGGVADTGLRDLWALSMAIVPLLILVRRVGSLPFLASFTYTLPSLGVLGLMGLVRPPVGAVLSLPQLIMATSGLALMGERSGHPIEVKKARSWAFQRLLPYVLVACAPVGILALTGGLAGLSAALFPLLSAPFVALSAPALSAVSAGND